jgi:hypothetical protein
MWKHLEQKMARIFSVFRLRIELSAEPAAAAAGGRDDGLAEFLVAQRGRRG